MEVQSATETLYSAGPRGVALQVGERFLKIWTCAQVEVDAALDRLMANAQRFFAVGTVAGAVGPHAEKCDFVVFAI